MDDTACARGSVLLITTYQYEYTYTGTVSGNDNISDVCTAAAGDTACSRGSVLLITYWYMYQYKHVQGHCLSQRMYRYSHEAHMINVLDYYYLWSSIIQRTVGRADRLHARKQSVAWQPHSDIADYYSQLYALDVCSIITTGYIDYVWRFTVCQAYYTID